MTSTIADMVRDMHRILEPLRAGRVKFSSYKEAVAVIDSVEADTEARPAYYVNGKLVEYAPGKE